MTGSLQNSRVLLGVTGSVAAYKAVELTRRLRQEGASVTVIMTEAAKHFVTPLSLEIASGHKACSNTFEDSLSHVEVPRSADIALIAPATANTIGKLANGLAGDLLSAAMLAFKGPVVFAPAMNWRMYENPALQANLLRLTDRGFVLVPPEKGDLACGEAGTGRLPSLDVLIEAVKSALSRKDFKGHKVVVTAGPTREGLDQVRFISNASSGKMGYALARVAARRGAETTLISGPSALEPPPGVSFIPVETARQMRSAVLGHLPEASAVVMAAAVSDFSPADRHKGKVQKASLKSITLELTPDILMEAVKAGHGPVLVGFAAETGANLKKAEKKLQSKGADLMVFNDISAAGSGFGSETNEVTLIEQDGEGSIKFTPLPLMSKEEVSAVVLDRVGEILARRAAPGDASG